MLCSLFSVFLNASTNSSCSDKMRRWKRRTKLQSMQLTQATMTRSNPLLSIQGTDRPIRMSTTRSILRAVVLMVRLKPRRKHLRNHSPKKRSKMRQRVDLRMKSLKKSKLLVANLLFLPDSKELNQGRNQLEIRRRLPNHLKRRRWFLRTKMKANPISFLRMNPSKKKRSTLSNKKFKIHQEAGAEV